MQKRLKFLQSKASVLTALSIYILLGLVVLKPLLVDASEKNSTTPPASIPSKITLATTQWAPYTATLQKSSTPQAIKARGIVTDYITQILAKHNIQLNVQYYPWSRAVKLANDNNHIHGLLTATQTEAPQLKFTRTPIMEYQVSFYTNLDTSWVYENEQSLNTLPLPLGVILDYGYGEPLDDFIRKNPDKLQVLSGDNAQLRLLKLLQFQRAEVIVDDEIVVKLHQDHSHPIRFAGQLSSSPFYLALNPELPWADQLIALLDQEFADEQNQLLLNSLVEAYKQ